MSKDLKAGGISVKGSAKVDEKEVLELRSQVDMLRRDNDRLQREAAEAAKRP
jgi:outer membrane murein-binding lipoprotein Lpp